MPLPPSPLLSPLTQSLSAGPWSEMDMGGGRLLIRFIIFILIMVLGWKVWEYMDLPPQLDTPPGYPQAGRREPAAEVMSYPPLNVVVYYEALCPDSRYFVIKQLKPAYGKLRSIMSISFVPYGKAQTTEKDGKYTFTCQHGAVECRANTVHACVTNAIRDEEKQLDIVSCMIERNEQPMKVGQKCVEKFGEDWSKVAQCVESDKGASILKHMGDMTHSLRPKVSFIPTVEIDGSLSEQTQIQQDLHKVLCRRYKGPKPPSC
ncbi:gamma-interferon-inducible lysosomal thiol reductase-like isoform X4 [Portunus trituberculatus]|uniref:gamma-interferon-inducible lysosomal thiol reductase-like isoform X4 n=1 Tax=Portunus trituberculatus TaxID=210409 RepID=UPI001E1CC7CB|nr:gamma-interferon-inducible lysosomal thiol reductase-like isoform X4 [Portunus trituberculatus]